MLGAGGRIALGDGFLEARIQVNQGTSSNFRGFATAAALGVNFGSLIGQSTIKGGTIEQITYRDPSINPRFFRVVIDTGQAESQDFFYSVNPFIIGELLTADADFFDSGVQGTQSRWEWELNDGGVGGVAWDGSGINPVTFRTIDNSQP